jgi:hypothetical protein
VGSRHPGEPSREPRNAARAIPACMRYAAAPGYCSPNCPAANGAAPPRVMRAPRGPSTSMSHGERTGWPAYRPQAQRGAPVVEEGQQALAFDPARTAEAARSTRVRACVRARDRGANGRRALRAAAPAAHTTFVRAKHTGEARAAARAAVRAHLARASTRHAAHGLCRSGQGPRARGLRRRVRGGGLVRGRTRAARELSAASRLPSGAAQHAVPRRARAAACGPSPGPARGHHGASCDRTEARNAGLHWPPSTRAPRRTTLARRRSPSRGASARGEWPAPRPPPLPAAIDARRRRRPKSARQ